MAREKTLFGARLQTLMNERRLTNEMLANALDRKDKKYVSELKMSQRGPNLETLAKIAGYFGVSIAWLVGETDDRSCRLTGGQGRGRR